MLLKIPAWNQLNDPLPDGDLDPDKNNDCGDECIAMCAYACIPAHPELSAGAVRSMLHGIRGSGITSADDIVHGLAKLDIPSHTRTCNYSTMLSEVQRANNARLPSIILGAWGYRGENHWMLAVGQVPGGLVFNDPNGGLRKTLTTTIQQLYLGVYVHVDRSSTI